MIPKAEIFDEIASLTPFMAGMSYDRLGGHGLVWPCTKPDRPGKEVLFDRSFPSGRGKLIPSSTPPPGSCRTMTIPSCSTRGATSTTGTPGPSPEGRRLGGRGTRPLRGNGARGSQAPEDQGRFGCAGRIEARGDHPPRPGFGARAARPGLHPLPLRRGRPRTCSQWMTSTPTGKSPSSSSAPSG